MQKITMVKKVLENGEPCRKCIRAEEMLRARGVWEHISEVLIVSDAQPSSPGAELARRHGISLAPFFVVQDGERERVIVNTLELLALFATARTPATNLPAALAPPESIPQLAEALAEREPVEILRWGVERFGERMALAFSGAEDVALIDMARRGGVPLRVFCLDTGRLHPETYRFVERVRAHYGLELEMWSPDASALQSFVRQKGLFSFYSDGHAQCCGVRKVEPLKRALGPLRAWVTGQRRDQSPTRTEVRVVELDPLAAGSAEPRLKLNPLAHWSSVRVWQYIRDNAV